MKVLIIEDSRELSESISSYLQNEQFVCETAEDFSSASEKISLYDYACIILDISLPGGSGLELLKDLKANHKSDGVIIISAKNSLDDKITGLRAGADDYLAKPFHLSELGARVAAVIRRKSFDGNTVMRVGDAEVNLNDKTVKISGTDAELTRKEYDLFLYFVSNKNRVISKGAIAEHLWGDDMDLIDNYDLVYTHIKNLRRKLSNAGGGDLIRSIYGMGYKLSINEAS